MVRNRRRGLFMKRHSAPPVRISEYLLKGSCDNRTEKAILPSRRESSLGSLRRSGDLFRFYTVRLTIMAAFPPNKLRIDREVARDERP